MTMINLINRLLKRYGYVISKVVPKNMFVCHESQIVTLRGEVKVSDYDRICFPHINFEAQRKYDIERSLLNLMVREISWTESEITDFAGKRYIAEIKIIKKRNDNSS